MQNNELSELIDVDLRKIWPNEAPDFTPWLAEEGIDLLSDQIGTDISVIEIEADAGNFSVDILAEEVDTGNIIIIENQLEKTNHDHLGKIITYASGLGASIVIWIFKEITEEHRQAIDWLNEITDDNTSFFGLEIKVYQIDDSNPAPKFETVCQPNEWPVNPDIISGIPKKQLKFWKKFMDYASNKNITPSQKSPKPRAYFVVRAGKIKLREAQINLRINTSEELMTCQLEVKDEIFFKFLESYAESINKELGLPSASWRQRSTAGKSFAIEQQKSGLQIDDEENYETYFAWFVEKASLFVQTFQPYVESFKPPPSSEESLDDED